MADEERVEIISVECLKIAAKELTPEKIESKVQDRALDPFTKEVLRKSMQEGVETVWDRFEKQQPSCKYCSTGVSCQRCAMGPCRLMGGDRVRGVCGADADLIVARNLLEHLATGAAAHSDHGRDVVETLLKAATGEAPSYGIGDEDKLRRLAKEYGIDDKLPKMKVAEKLALAMLGEFGTLTQDLRMSKRVPEETFAIWKKLGIFPRGIDREVVEIMHRTHMGVDQDYENIVKQCSRTALAVPEDRAAAGLGRLRTLAITFSQPPRECQAETRRGRCGCRLVRTPDRPPRSRGQPGHRLRVSHRVSR